MPTGSRASKKTAGTTASHRSEDIRDWSYSDEDEPFYTLRQNYGGDAKRRIETYGQRSQGFNHGKGPHAPRRQVKTRPGQRRLNSRCRRGVKGSFYSVQSHRSIHWHPREDVTAAINKFNEWLPSALLTVSDIAYIVDLCINDQGDAGEDTKFIAEWVEEDEDDTENSSLAYVAIHDLISIELNLSSSPFVQGRRFSSGLYAPFLSMNSQLSEPYYNRFHGVRLGTCANRRSIMPTPNTPHTVNRFA